jgi:hypothetical protein
MCPSDGSCRAETHVNIIQRMGRWSVHYLDSLGDKGITMENTDLYNELNIRWNQVHHNA